MARDLRSAPRNKIVLRPAVFLDRDGVINANLLLGGRSVAPANLAQFRLLPGVAAAVRSLKERGYLVVIVTNQPDVASGRTSRAAVEAMHVIVRANLAVDDIRVCFHGDTDGCACRKPKPGMILAAAAEHDVDLSRSCVVGDRWRDIAAGRAAGCSTIFIDRGYRQEVRYCPDQVAKSLPEAVAIILGRPYRFTTA